MMKDGEANAAVPVLRAITPEAVTALQGDVVRVHVLPFRVGRESRMLVVGGEVQTVERRKLAAPPNNDLYILDNGKHLNISREHFQIEQDEDGGYSLRDRGSACGTIVDDVHVGGNDSEGVAPLEAGSVIRVGTTHSPYVFEFAFEGAGDAA